MQEVKINIFFRTKVGKSCILVRNRWLELGYVRICTAIQARKRGESSDPTQQRDGAIPNTVAKTQVMHTLNVKASVGSILAPYC